MKGDKKTILERINAELDVEVEKTLKQYGELFKLGDMIKSYSIIDINPGKIIFGKSLGEDGKFYLDNEVEALFNLYADYENDFLKLHSKFNRSNPYKIEINFEKEAATEGTIVNAFGQWIMAPLRPAESYNSKLIQEGIDYPKFAVIAFRPEKIHKVGTLISKLIEDFKYEPTHFRFGNELNKEGSASLVISRYESNHFKHFGSPKDEIIEKWAFLIPALEESFE